MEYSISNLCKHHNQNNVSFRMRSIVGLLASMRTVADCLWNTEVSALLVALHRDSSERGDQYILPISRCALRNTPGSRPRLWAITLSTRRLSSLHRRKKDVWISWKSDDGHFYSRRGSIRAWPLYRLSRLVMLSRIQIYISLSHIKNKQEPSES